jgi:hypothetical protein
MSLTKLNVDTSTQICRKIGGRICLREQCVFGAQRMRFWAKNSASATGIPNMLELCPLLQK